MEAIAADRQRILLTLATGTGKTFIAFQIAWKLFHSRWNLSREPSRRPRILFLADRNILADQAYNAFSAFPEDALVRIEPEDIRKKGKVPKNGSIFFTIFQTFMSGPPKDGQPSPYFGEYPPDFFDFIVIDECHRGGANDESNWRGILEYFAPAVQLGLTATPKRTGQRRHLQVFRRAGLHLFAQGRHQRRFPDAVQGEADFHDARRICLYAGRQVGRRRDRDRQAVHGNRLQQDHRDQGTRGAPREAVHGADRPATRRRWCSARRRTTRCAVRDLINQMKTSKDPNYCQRVTADDGALGDQHLRDFQDNEKTIPTILTTSQKLSTGVDARNIRNIVLMRPINSMIEFKQIIGRGTRLYDGKDYFTIYDFVKAYDHFNDPEWDGEPIEPEPKNRGDRARRALDLQCRLVRSRSPLRAPRKIKVKLADGKERTIQHMMATTILASGRHAHVGCSSSWRCFSASCRSSSRTRPSFARFGARPTLVRNYCRGLAEKGSARDQLAEMQQIIDAEKSDLFDVLAYVAYAMPPITREDRAARAKVVISTHFNTKQQVFLDFVLSHYVSVGVDQLDQEKLTPLLKLKYHDSIADAIADFGKAEEIRSAFAGFQRFLYQEAA